MFYEAGSSPSKSLGALEDKGGKEGHSLKEREAAGRLRGGESWVRPSHGRDLTNQTAQVQRTSRPSHQHCTDRMSCFDNCVMSVPDVGIRGSYAQMTPHFGTTFL